MLLLKLQTGAVFWGASLFQMSLAAVALVSKWACVSICTGDFNLP